VDIENRRKILELKIRLFCVAATIQVVLSFVLLSRLGQSPSLQEIVQSSAAMFIPMVLLLNWMFQTLYAGIPQDKQSAHQPFVRNFQIGSWVLTVLLLFAVVFVSLWNM
jgi:hypothetical protein